MARIVFDLDGTLVHSAPTMASAGNALLAELGRAPVSEAVCVGFVGNGMTALVERLLRHTGGIPGGAVGPHAARYRALYAADPLTGTQAYPGVDAALAALAGAGHGLAVCTQKANALGLAILGGLGLMPPITGFTGGESLDVLKPDPRMLWHAAGQIGGGAVLLVGDSETDAATARAADVPFLLHTRGYRHATPDEIPHTAAFGDFEALPELIATLLSVSR